MKPNLVDNTTIIHVESVLKQARQKANAIKCLRFQ